MDQYLMLLLHCIFLQNLFIIKLNLFDFQTILHSFTLTFPNSINLTIGLHSNLLTILDHKIGLRVDLGRLSVLLL